MSDLLSHRNDPQTSRDAAEKAAPRAGSHAAIILNFLSRDVAYTPSYISSWLANHVDFSQDTHTRLYQVRRRLSDLKRKGFAVQDGRVGDEACWKRVVM